jgi:adapter protein MecA 1/2
MIEAIPLNSECIVLVITKVEDPEELDTRFSKFAPSVHDDDNEQYHEFGSSLDNMLQSLSEGADEVLDLFKKIHEGHSNNDTVSNTLSKTPVSSNALPVNEGYSEENLDLTRIYGFESLTQVIRLAHIIAPFYNGKNSLYKNENTSSYMLVVSQSQHTPEQFNRICNMLSEYGSLEKFVSASEAYMEEHFEPIIKNNAIQSLSQI